MKPVEFNRQLECDDGIFNIGWVQDGRYRQVPCEWQVLGGGGKPCEDVSRNGDFTGIKNTNYWCVECGMVVCLKHRKGHSTSFHHNKRMELSMES